MPKVFVDIMETDLDGDYSSVPGISAECKRCHHTVEVFGQEEGSILRACALLREECPNNESNFYEEDTRVEDRL